MSETRDAGECDEQKSFIAHGPRACLVQSCDPVASVAFLEFDRTITELVRGPRISLFSFLILHLL